MAYEAKLLDFHGRERKSKIQSEFNLACLETSVDDAENQGKKEVQNETVPYISKIPNSTGSVPEMNTKAELATVSLSTQAEINRLKSQRRITKIFFIVGVIFISIAIPTTVASTVFSLRIVQEKLGH